MWVYVCVCLRMFASSFECLWLFMYVFFWLCVFVLVCVCLCMHSCVWFGTREFAYDCVRLRVLL